MSEIRQKAAFVSIIGKPNAGKSTLLNSLINQKLAITNPKVQTTRHRIKAIVNQDNTQLVFSDTPGIIDPNYKLQEEMMNAVKDSIEDADIVIVLVDVQEPYLTDEVLSLLKESEAKKILVLNKADLSDQEHLAKTLEKLQNQIEADDSIIASALHKFNVNELLSKLIALSPEHPPYYPEHQFTDKPTRFFVAEFIREKILTHYQKEIPYSVEVVVDSYKEEKNITKISAIIYVERDSQKVILIGKNGLGLKRIGTEARRDIERFIDDKVFLKIFVKVKKKWRNDERLLKSFGYKNN
jgi:GTP-binding protein Era